MFIKLDWLAAEAHYSACNLRHIWISVSIFSHIASRSKSLKLNHRNYSWPLPNGTTSQELEKEQEKVQYSQTEVGFSREEELGRNGEEELGLTPSAMRSGMLAATQQLPLQKLWEVRVDVYVKKFSRLPVCYNKHLSSAYSVLGTMLYTGDTHKKKKNNPCPQEVYNLQNNI